MPRTRTSEGSSSSSSNDNSVSPDTSWPIAEVCNSIDLNVQPVSVESGELLRPLFTISADGALEVLVGKMYFAGQGLSIQ